ncbi:COG0535 Predicted Fe-S oxidoreductases [uncultured Caudovirales phage]|uniref:COG0535 Predicted Fe-S oxidoreductases n=1 Tax=uncultured Caudovirales phage TaxID=2100421 RepID=A0A6J5P905_9CAUD|nr:COG0535 Predicted Fe-S oxidoreductases [uncultured Caudovirales phage]CAB4165736.1 COG0535 Predicted Fe-S oxidoreductases [uncultured Caudovirales phage]CAB4187034.1 COG0535 Predicted Fe-S oxidoreductases [uncultured Caudovirales phage]CAB4221167.1 COG0535 Predicted Fe-S oxidoreductases [uncultured Caudovirales phage]
MNIPHDKFCVLPWVSLETSPIGTVRPCCLADDEIVDDAGNKFDLHQAGFQNIQDSSHMRDLRQEFIDGKQPKTCRKCWNEERGGRTSKRMHTLDRLKHMLPEQSWTADAKPLMFLDLKLGNICNLKCRICGSWSSSTFAVEELKNLPVGEDSKNNHHFTMLRAGAWPRENPSFWQEIAHVSKQIQYIEFTGGEPFMIREHFDMLQRLVDQGLADNIEIHYNTNGTQWPNDAENIWKHFKLVEIAFSIDDVAERFEYQRSNAVWTEVCDNIQKFKELRNRYKNIQLQVCCTVNVFNVYYLETVAQWIANQQFDYIYWNIMHDAWYFSVASLPDTAKSVITDILLNADVLENISAEFKLIVEFMNKGASTDGAIMRMRIADLDRKRSQHLSIVEPEFANLINYEKP